ncbi:hypothetical protein CS533_12225 [Yersinia bercovieri]|uniref:Uncharacterized protein n=1 Tax=Yersinia bercovieri TaxID=634 RepID=A0A2G4U1S4_YERBE|nr:hypothetical protein CS533_12225 [Yersinia bercovieri]
MLITINNDLHYDLLLLRCARCIAISTGCAHNQFPFPCSNGYWNAAPIVHAIGAFYLAVTPRHLRQTTALRASHGFSHKKSDRPI